MNKFMSVILMITGVVFMAMLSILYSFSTVEISTGAYMALWCLCIAMVRVSAGRNREL